MGKPTVSDRTKAVEDCLLTLKHSKVPTVGQFIQRGDYGIGTWAAIDCLTHYHNYTLVAVLPKGK